MKETFESIKQWQSETFGEVSILSAYLKLQREVQEIWDGFRFGGLSEDELADVYITLVGLCRALHIDLNDVVNKKMAINRKRKWVKQPDGTFQHEV